MTPKFRVGDVVTIIGEGHWSHNFKIGDRVTVVSVSEPHATQGYGVIGKVRGEGPDIHQTIPEHQAAFAEQPPTEAEINETLESIHRSARTEEVR